MQKKRSELYSDIKGDYDELVEERGRALESLQPEQVPIQAQTLMPTQSLMPPAMLVQQETQQDLDETDSLPEQERSQADPEAVTALMLKIDLLLNQALRIPPDEQNTLAEYPDKLLNLEKKLTTATDTATVQAIALELRELEIDFKQQVVRNVTAITEKTQRARNFRTMRLIPGVIFLYSVLMIVVLLQSDEFYSLPLFNIPLSVLGAGLVGGVTALYYRYRNVSPGRLTDNDVVWFFTKPLIGVLMAGLSYGAIQAGFFVFEGDITVEATMLWPYWILAWLVGFSDWFFDTFIVQVVGRLTGDQSDDMLENLTREGELSEAERYDQEIRNLTTEQQRRALAAILRTNNRGIRPISDDDPQDNDNSVNTPDPSNNLLNAETEHEPDNTAPDNANNNAHSAG